MRNIYWKVSALGEGLGLQDGRPGLPAGFCGLCHYHVAVAGLAGACLPKRRNGGRSESDDVAELINGADGHGDCPSLPPLPERGFRFWVLAF